METVGVGRMNLVSKDRLEVDVGSREAIPSQGPLRLQYMSTLDGGMNSMLEFAEITAT